MKSLQWWWKLDMIMTAQSQRPTADSFQCTGTRKVFVNCLHHMCKINFLFSWCDQPEIFTMTKVITYF